MSAVLPTKTWSLVCLLCCLDAARPIWAQPGAGIDRPESATAMIRRFSADEPLPLVVRLEEGQSRADFILEGEKLDLEGLVRKLRIERARRGERRGSSEVEVVLVADRSFPFHQLHPLLHRCLALDVGVHRFWLETALPSGSPEGTKALLPIFLIDRSLDWSEAAQGDAPLDPAQSASALERSIGRMGQFSLTEMRVGGERVDGRGLAARGAEARLSSPKGWVSLCFVSSTPLEHVVALVDLLRCVGYRTGGGDDSSEIILHRPMGAVSRARLRELSPLSISFGEDAPFIYPYVSPREELDLALGWLAGHQAPDGRWDADGFTAADDPVFPLPSGGAGRPDQDLAVTSLACLAFLGSGSTHKAGHHKENIGSALRWLRDQQTEDGSFAAPKGDDFLLQQALATLTMNEAYGLTRSPLFMEPYVPTCGETPDSQILDLGAVR